jgi:uncharacterized protein
MSTLQTERTTVKRLAKRGNYDSATVHAILDEALICHVAFVVDGSPVVIPTIHARIGDTLYVHGSAASRMLRTLRQGVDTCVCVTLLDGLVIARSGFHHSMNYRSVVIFGKATEVVVPEAKRLVLDAIVDHVAHGRSADARPPNEIELKQTLVLSLPIEEASAKIRTGGPIDDEEDYALPIWAGVLPLRIVPGEPIPDEKVLAPIPDYVTNYRR